MFGGVVVGWSLRELPVALARTSLKCVHMRCSRKTNVIQQGMISFGLSSGICSP
jgi:hypothetical protein